jgi:hypothetical protein
MSNDTKKAVAEMLAPMLKKTLFVAISRVAAPASATEPFVAEHLAYRTPWKRRGTFGPPARSSRRVSSSGTA